MFPLHSNLRSLPVIFILFFFASCSDRSKTDLTIIKALDESLITSNRLLYISTNDILLSLREKQYEAGTMERAKVWFSKAEKIESLSKNVYDYIEKIKAEILGTSEDNLGEVQKLIEQRKDKIYDTLKNYKLETLAVDAKINEQFNRSIVIFSSSFDSTGENGNDLFDTFFNTANSYSLLAMLTRMQNNIKIVENKTITFCHEQVGSTDGGGFCSFISAIAIMNSTIVQPGEKIEIISGVGSFDSRSDPKVFVYDKQVPLNESAIAICKFKAEKKPGKYYVPVKIHYTDQDGRKQSIQKEIEYTVANIQKQE